MHRCLAVLLALTCVAVAVSPRVASAQATAQISGRVTDQSAGVLPGVTVTATQTQTGIVRSSVTDETGSYVLPNLPLGPYRLEVFLSGFRTFVQTGIGLQVNASPVIDVVLEVGQLAESVSVEANAAMVETRSPGVSQVIENERTYSAAAWRFHLGGEDVRGTHPDRYGQRLQRERAHRRRVEEAR